MRMLDATLYESSVDLRQLYRSLALDDRRTGMVHCLHARDIVRNDLHAHSDLDAAIHATLLALTASTQEALLAAREWGRIADMINTDAGYSLDLATAGNPTSGGDVIDAAELLDRPSL